MNEPIFEIKRNISFFLEKRKDKNGLLITTNVPIRLSITYNGKRVMLNAGNRVDASKWNDEKQRVISNTTHPKQLTASEINSRLNNLEAGINHFFKTCEVKRIVPTQADLKKAVDQISKQKKVRKETFFTAFDDFLHVTGKTNEWDEDTFIKFGVIRRHLESFDKHVSFESFTVDKMLDLVDYLRLKRDMRNTTIVKSLSFVKWFLRWAFRNGYQVSQDVLNFNPRLKGTDGKIKKVVFLSIEELTRLYELELPESKDYLERVRDVFVFCCFTGLRYSDAYNLKKSDDKGTCIEFVSQKTSESLKIETNKYSRALLDKYKDVPLKNDKALPVISNQKMNAYLKELGELAGLTSPETIVYFKGNQRHEEVYPKYAVLTSHCARKTFITNLLYLGVSDRVIREWTGHRDQKSFDVYHKIVDEIKSREMSKFDEI